VVGVVAVAVDSLVVGSLAKSVFVPSLPTPAELKPQPPSHAAATIACCRRRILDRCTLAA